MHLHTHIDKHRHTQCLSALVYLTQTILSFWNSISSQLNLGASASPEKNNKILQSITETKKPKQTD